MKRDLFVEPVVGRMTTIGTIPVETQYPGRAMAALNKDKRGFTLIELLIVVVIIGILAAIAIPKFANTKGKANAAALKSDLRNLATAQEAYFYDNASYTTVITDLAFKSSPGVVLTVPLATGSGWQALATHPASFPLTCAIYFGNVAPLPPATVEGLIGCQ